MKRIVGYTLFWVAVGMLLALCMPNAFVTVLIIFVLLLLGYNLFMC